MNGPRYTVGRYDYPEALPSRQSSLTGSVPSTATGSSGWTEQQGEAIANGTWYVIHLMARSAVDQQTKEAFIQLMNTLAQSYWCERCRRHMNDYLRSHPIAPFWNYRDVNSREIGMFKWAWQFHNAVNRRLGKPEVSWEDAYVAYYEPEVHICTEGCNAISSEYNSSAQHGSYSKRGNRFSLH